MFRFAPGAAMADLLGDYVQLPFFRPVDQWTTSKGVSYAGAIAGGRPFLSFH
jgi:hypothetical protein